MANLTAVKDCTIQDYFVYLPEFMSDESGEQAGNRKLAQTWATRLIDDLVILGKPNIMLKITERHRATSEITWSAIIASSPDGLKPIGTDGPYIMETVQNYTALNLLHPEEDYMGKLEISIAMNNTALGTDICTHATTGQIAPLTPTWKVAKMILRWAGAHYYEQIATVFPEWRTQYNDCLRYTDLQKVDQDIQIEF